MNSKNLSKDKQKCLKNIQWVSNFLTVYEVINYVNTLIISTIMFLAQYLVQYYLK